MSQDKRSYHHFQTTLFDGRYSRQRSSGEQELKCCLIHNPDLAGGSTATIFVNDETSKIGHRESLTGQTYSYPEKTEA